MKSVKQVRPILNQLRIKTPLFYFLKVSKILKIYSVYFLKKYSVYFLLITVFENGK